jgi:recombination protein RecA
MARKKKATGVSMVDVTKNVSASLQKMFKNTGINIQSGITADSSANVTTWIPTGCRPLDLAISNLPDRGGFPCGRITILYGPEQSGKSLLAMHAIANTQKLGGKAVYIDAEFSIHEEFAKSIGVDLTQLDYLAENQAETIMVLVEGYCSEFRKNFPDTPLTIVVDSIASMVTEDNLKNGHNSVGYDTSLSKLLSTSLKVLGRVVSEHNVALIFTNQARMKMNIQNPRENPYKPFGGQAAPHYASLIIFMEKSSKIKGKVKGEERLIGRSARVRTIKNRLAPPEVSLVLDIYFDRGIDDFESWYNMVKAFGNVTFNGAWISYTSKDGREFKENGWNKFCKKVLEPNPDIAEEIWLHTANEFIVKYKNRDEDTEGMEIVRESELDTPANKLNSDGGK